MKPKAADLIRAAPRFLGVPYSTMECQAFVEAALREIGINVDLAGSNTWFRKIRENGWTGTPAECIRKYGEIPKGAFLFILENDGKEPEKYRKDGIGNASHIGIYTGMTGEEMCRIAAEEGIEDPEKYNFGNGAIHSSSKRKAVCTSNFKGKAISGGWNRIGIWDKIDYGTKEGSEKMKAIVCGPNGKTVFLRKKPSKSADWICRVKSGETVEILGTEGEWDKVYYPGENEIGYMMYQYLSPAGQEGEGTVPVEKNWLINQRKWYEEQIAEINRLLGVTA